MLNASCNCGAVTFSVTPDTRVTACHCGQCRKQSGHHWASGSAPFDRFSISGDVRWFETTPTARRGFCPICGSFLFWKHNDETNMSFSLGAVDGPTGLALEEHIFTAFKGDYYELTDDVPQRED